MNGCQGTLIVPEEVLPCPKGPFLSQQPANQQACLHKISVIGCSHHSLALLSGSVAGTHVACEGALLSVRLPTGHDNE